MVNHLFHTLRNLGVIVLALVILTVYIVVNNLNNFLVDWIFYRWLV